MPKDTNPDGPMEEFYHRLQVKYNLPAWEALYADFELNSIEDSELLLAQIRTKMAEKLEGYTMFLQPVLHPDTNLNDLQECRCFSDDEKKPLYDFYARLMALVKRGMRALVLSDEKEDASFIKDAAQQYPNIKKEMAAILEKLEEGWKNKEEAPDDQGYFG
ncbi:hypothetical protein HYU19_02105 [Candidatus Woesearchaeota archaeon]|nr:hypothetical protein [Candidatus Woesearchaeota archaeon]